MTYAWRFLLDFYRSLSMLKSAPVVLLNIESIKGERNQETSVGMEKGGRRVYIVGFCRQLL